MTFWLKTRRVWPVAVAGWLLSLALTIAVGGEQLMLPSLVLGSQQTALTMFVPMPLVVALAFCLDSRVPAAEATGVRPVRAYDCALVAVLLAAYLAVAGLLGSATVAAAARNAAFLTGLMLVARPVAGQGAVMAPVAWLMGVVFLNRRPPSDPDPWTVLPEPATAPHAVLAAAAVLTIALITLARTRKDPE